MEKIGDRDLEYIETRLLAPAVAATEAVERMRECGLGNQADRLVLAIQSFTETCRVIRYTITFMDTQEANDGS